MVAMFWKGGESQGVMCKGSPKRPRESVLPPATSDWPCWCRYSLLADSLRCSETGAKFSQDMMSKHAMHAAGAEEVLYAGRTLLWA